MDVSAGREANAQAGQHTPSPWVRLALPLILLLAAAARLYGIGQESLWLDEATSLMLARMAVPDLIAWTALDIHPPLFYTLLHYWIALGESEAVLRGLSALAGVLNVAVIYALGETLFGRKVGLLAAAVLALAPYHIWYSQEVRMYAWVTLWITASIWLALRFLASRGWGPWLGHVLVTAAAWYTHYYAVFGILLVNLLFLYLLVRRRVDRTLFWRWVAAQIAVLLLFAPWIPTFLLPITVGGGGWISMGMGRPGLSALAQTLVLYMVGTGRALYPELLRRLGYGLLVALLVVGLWPGRSRRGDAPSRVLLSTPEAMLFTLAYLALPLGLAWGVSQVGKPMYSARYMLPFLIPFCLLVARGISLLPGRWLAMATLVAVLGLQAVGVQAQVRLQDKPDWRGLAAQLRAVSEPGDIVVMMPGWHAKPLTYYAGDPLAVYADIPVPVPQYGDQAIQAVEDAIAGHPRIWYVWEEGHYTDPEGAVYRHLASRYEELHSSPLPLVGRVILFANLQAGGTK